MEGHLSFNLYDIAAVIVYSCMYLLTLYLLLCIREKQTGCKKGTLLDIAFSAFWPVTLPFICWWAWKNRYYEDDVDRLP